MVSLLCQTRYRCVKQLPIDRGIERYYTVYIAPTSSPVTDPFSSIMFGPKYTNPPQSNNVRCTRMHKEVFKVPTRRSRRGRMYPSRYTANNNFLTATCRSPNLGSTQVEAVSNRQPRSAFVFERNKIRSDNVVQPQDKNLQGVDVTCSMVNVSACVRGDFRPRFVYVEAVELREN